MVGAAVTALAVAGFVVADDDPPADGVRVAAEPAPETAPPSTAPSSTFVMGVVGEIDVAVAPRTGLVDGQLLTLTVEGADGLPDDAIVLMCTGEVRGASSAIAGCDAEAVTRPDGTPRPDVTEGEQQVAVSRFLHVAQDDADLNVRTPYDCATEPAGCILVLAPFRLPPTAVAMALGFADAPVALPAASAVPASGLADGQVVTVEASGLRPRAAHQVGQCVPVEGDGARGPAVVVRRADLRRGHDRRRGPAAGRGPRPRRRLPDRRPGRLHGDRLLAGGHVRHHRGGRRRGGDRLRR